MTFLRVVQQILILPLYFKYPLFKVDFHYFLHYWNQNPYRICNRYFREKEKKEVFYGDTWPYTIFKFVQSIPISKEDVLFDLGSGIGRMSFWFQKISQCKVVAIEKVPYFVQKAKEVQKKVGNQNITFLKEDLLETNYESATLIYFYCSSFDDETILKLLKKWKSLKKGARILTTSFALSEYKAQEYKVIQQFKVSYPWGICDVFLQMKI